MIEGTTTLRIWNLTPHAIVYDDGLHRQQFPSDATVRLSQKESTSEPIGFLQTVGTTYGPPEGLPEAIAAGDVLLVSSLVAEHWPEIHRLADVIVLVPDTGPTCRRSSDGQVSSVCRFIRK